MLVLDRVLPEWLNPKGSIEVQHETRVRRWHRIFEHRTDSPAKKALIFLVVMVVLLVSLQFVVSCIPWYVFHEVPVTTVTLADGATVVHTVYAPGLMDVDADSERMQAFTHYLEEYRGLLPVVTAKEVRAEIYTLRNLDPNMYYGLDGINISFARLKKNMLEVLRVHDVKHGSHDGKAVCAIEFGIPLNIVLLNGKDPENPTLMYEPILTRFTGEDWAFVSIESNLRPTSSQRWYVDTPPRGRIDYITETGASARTVLHQRDLAHVLFCSMQFSDPQVVTFDNYWTSMNEISRKK
jgi:hypothetical protein